MAALRYNGAQEPNTTYFSRNPYGHLEGATGTGGTLNPGTGFTGASTPNSTGGFTYLRNRWYDPQTGRFLTQDPIGLAGGVNLYAYAGNNPVAFSDPFGLSPCCKWLRKLASAAAGFIPVVGEVSDATTVVTGRDLISNERVGLGGRAAAVAGFFIPAVSGGTVRSAGRLLGRAGEAIQSFATKYGMDVHVVGSRARGTAGSNSDWDYVIDGNSRVRRAARRELPRGHAGGEIQMNGRESGIDVFDAKNTPLRTDEPFITVT